jgi:hypothetical protein
VPLLNGAGEGRRNLDRRLVSLDFHEGRILADELARAGVQPNDLPLVHAFTKIWKFEFGHESITRNSASPAPPQ